MTASVSRPSPGFWREAWARFRRERLAMAGLILVLLLLVAALLAPVLANEKPIAMSYAGTTWFPGLREALRRGPAPELAMVDYRFLDKDPKVGWYVPAPIPYSPASEDLGAVLAGPSGAHWLGTDNIGRDVLARMLHGAGVSLMVGFVAAGVALLIGVLLGSLAGYFGGFVDVAVGRLIEVLQAFPTIILILTVIALLEPSIWKIMLVIGLTSWTGEARFVRAEVLRLRDLEFVTAARVMGAGWTRILFRHVLPNGLAPALVSSTFSIGSAILTEAGLSFLGFGIQPPAPSWGSILSQSQQYQQQWWLAVFPGLAIFLTVSAYNLVGEGFRDAIDPRLARRQA